MTPEYAAYIISIDLIGKQDNIALNMMIVDGLLKCTKIQCQNAIKDCIYRASQKLELAEAIRVLIEFHNNKDK